MPTAVQDPDSLLAEEIQKLLNESKTTKPGDPPVEGSKIPLTVFGQQFSFDDPRALSAAVERTLTQAAQESQRLVAQAQQQQTQPQAVTDPDPDPSFSPDEFVKRLTSDPRKGIEYVIQHETGMDFAQLKNVMLESQQAAKVIHAEQFKSMHPEYPVNNPTLANVLDQTRERLGLPFTAQGIEAAYFTALNSDPTFRNTIQQNMNAQQAARQQAQAQTAQPSQFGDQSQNPYFSAPPGVPRSGNFGGSDPLANLEDLSIEQLEKLASRLN